MLSTLNTSDLQTKQLKLLEAHLKESEQVSEGYRQRIN